MRTTAMMVLATVLAGCGDSKAKEARADARAADFVPPSIISRLDYGSAAERRFRRLDHNNDDHIGAAELPQNNSRMMTLDRDHDGQISEQEWSEGMLNRFDRLDTNHDGALTSEERAADRTVK